MSARRAEKASNPVVHIARTTVKLGVYARPTVLLS